MDPGKKKVGGALAFLHGKESNCLKGENKMEGD